MCDAPRNTGYSPIYLFIAKLVKLLILFHYMESILAALLDYVDRTSNTSCAMELEICSMGCIHMH